MEHTDSIRKIFIDYIDDQNLVEEYLRDNNYTLHTDSDSGYTWYESSDELEVVDIILEEIINTMPINEFLDVLEGFDENLLTFLSELSNNDHMRLKKALLYSDSTKQILRSIKGKI